MMRMGLPERDALVEQESVEQESVQLLVALNRRRGVKKRSAHKPDLVLDLTVLPAGSRRAGAPAGLGVSFHQVVHPGASEEAGVATLQLRGEARMNAHENARTTPRGREELVRRVSSRRQTAQRGRSGCRRLAAHRPQVGRPVQGGRRAGSARSLSRPRRLRPDEPGHRGAGDRASPRALPASISPALGVSPATVSRVLRRAGSAACAT